MHSTAVDFSKTGQPVDSTKLQDLLIRARNEVHRSGQEIELVGGTTFILIDQLSNRTQLWPDFMGKDQNLSGNSKVWYSSYDPSKMSVHHLNDHPMIS